ncbi:MAG: tRNA preQ1(34) S-adenosylmethionine ribosyltransferase-isomerase QueA [Actinobacteria bacterium]|nr:MAG: tRNA preQ1(34) S-adenosylmethionine ribosyltransferase-isomerase QueA [Actinomycetota bacterium]
MVTRSEFDYQLPPERIAAQPLGARDASRLLVDHGDRVEHRLTADLADYVRAGDVIVINDTKVLPARVRFRRSTGGTGEVLLLEPRDDDRHDWDALVRPSRKLTPGSLVTIGDDLAFVFGDDLGNGRRVVRVESSDLHRALDAHGEMPLPPYLPGPIDDPARYQTIYASRPASAAAPTAGLHLTQATLDACAARGAQLARVELVVGLDTFRPITVDDLSHHEMHSEYYRVPDATMQACLSAERVVAIGTTTVRALESAATRGELEGRTNLFIHRGYEFKVVDALMTNFHLPCSTLLVMIDAFVGSRWRDLYDIALREQYRFLSFGDAMLLQHHL